MQYHGWLILNIFTIIIAILLLVFQRDNNDNSKSKIFIYLVLVTMTLIIVDSVNDFYNDILNINNALIKTITSCFVYAFDPFEYLLSIFYIDQYIETKNNKFRNVFMIPMTIFVFVNFVSVILSTIFGWHLFFYYVDGVYYRGSLYMLRAFISIVFCVLVQIYVIINRRNINPIYRIYLTMYPSIVMLGGLLQLLFSGLNLLYSATIIACLLLFTYVQRINLDIDYLTQSNNRRFIDDFLEKLIENKTPYMAAMFDVDYFKQINDEFGHNVGDEVLVKIAEFLKKSFHDPAIVGRYGGDEYFAIYPKASKEDMEKSIKLFRDALKEYNDTNPLFKVSVSIGYGSFDSNIYKDINEFKKHIDELMYEEKKVNHLEIV